jgi:hypothetical protein
MKKCNCPTCKAINERKFWDVAPRIFTAEERSTIVEAVIAEYPIKTVMNFIGDDDE